MRCPFCGKETTVIDKRTADTLNHIRRRRRCSSKKCGITFSTIEVATIVPTSAKRLLKWMTGDAPVTEEQEHVD